jgi:hypothetical protein
MNLPGEDQGRSSPRSCTNRQGAACGAVHVHALANVGQELDYLDGPDFQRFWDTDGERTDAAVKAIGRQG